MFEKIINYNWWHAAGQLFGLCVCIIIIGVALLLLIMIICGIISFIHDIIS